MSYFYYIVHADQDGPATTHQSLEEVFAFLKNTGFISVFRYNDKKTGSAYANLAAEYCLSSVEQEQRPVFVTTAVSDEGVFVESEAFWIENYMIDEFYNPERTPHIEALVSESE